ncbi:MAG: SGNH/GDSL hydrolase family protein [Prevotellaceae bacterium]|jgi:lysophospholipase L1-like esterase|nr:SGNH/GDSL hydrolase family protein [Prevotellaceae bacterium]
MKRERISRRKFIAVTSIAGAVASMTPGSVFAKSLYKADSVSDKEKGLTFLFQGDSITDGNWGQSGSNNRNLMDGNHILGHGYVFAVASRLGADFPAAGFTFHNRGISGNKVSDLENRWETDAVAIKPDVLSILIGVNDAGAVIRNSPDSYDAETFESKYHSLLLRSKEANPDILFVLAPPFIYPVGVHKGQWDLWNREVPLRAEAVRKLAKEFDAVFVDYPDMFARATKSVPVDYWIWDGCHPSIYGHELMAREWIKQVSTRLKFLKKYDY